MFMRGSPFIYYGEEIAMRPGTGVVVDMRDSARTPMTWTKAPGFGFSTAKPWIDFGEGSAEINVETEDADPKSMLTFYRQLLAFRRGHPVWSTGEMRLLDVDNSSLLAFTRKNNEEAYLVVESFAEDAQEGTIPVSDLSIGELGWGEGTAAAKNGGLSVSLPAESSAVFRLR
jgi:glycosidase